MRVFVPMAGMFEADKFAGGTEVSYLIFNIVPTMLEKNRTWKYYRIDYSSP